MTLNAKLNGIPCVIEVPDEQLSRLVAPQELTARQAWQFMGISEATFYRRGIPKTRNNRYSVETLKKYMV